jgi:hypothetical protein
MSNTIGQDTIYHISQNHNLVFIVVHLSNDTNTFNTQIIALKDFCSNYPNKTVIIMGDYNAIPKICTQSSNTIKFYSKDLEVHELTLDNYNNILSFENRKIHVSNITAATTCKQRIITTQIIKVLKKISAVIDGIIIIEPVVMIRTEIIITTDSANANTNTNTNTTTNTNTNTTTKINPIYTISSLTSGVVIFNNEITTDTISPIEWPSDHYVAYSSIKMAHNVNFNVGTWNVFGESVDKKAYNIFEMASKFVIDQINSNPEIETTLWKIIKSQPDINGKNFEQLYMSKVFSRELRDFNVFTVHCPPINESIIDCELLHELKAMYQLEYDKMLSTATEQQLVYAKAILNMWNEFYTDPLLSDLFSGWFNDMVTFPKFSFDQIVMEYLKNNVFHVFGLQEVNSSMLNKLHELRNMIDELGYNLIAPNKINTKTCGVILISKHLT